MNDSFDTGEGVLLGTQSPDQDLQKTKETKLSLAKKKKTLYLLSVGIMKL